MISPTNKATRGALAPVGEIGAIGSGGRISQLRVAPQTIAAKDNTAVGAQKKILVLWMFRSGGCMFIPSCLM